MEFDLLSTLDEADRRTTLAGCVRRRFQRSEIIFHEGDPGDSLHLLARGRVAIRVATGLGDSVVLDVIGPGRAFGEQALISEAGRRNATAVALEEVETLVLVRSRFEELRREHERVATLLVTALDARVGRLMGLLVETLTLPAETRVLRRVRHLADVYGDGTSAIIPLTQEDIASMAGTTRSTVNRTLQSAARAGAVRLGRGRIEVDDMAGLEKLCREADQARAESSRP